MKLMKFMIDCIHLLMYGYIDQEFCTSTIFNWMQHKNDTIGQKLGRFDHINSLQKFLELDSAMAFLTNNNFIGGANSPHGIIVTWVD